MPGSADVDDREEPADRPRRHALRREIVRWLASIALFLPALLPLVSHLGERIPGLEPSGFLQPDMPYYAATGREHFDEGGFHLLYGLPSSPHEDTPRLYVQPQSLMLGTLMRAGLDPGAAFWVFGAAAAIAAIRVALALFEHLFGLARSAQRMAALAWIWGGGVLVAVGATRMAGSGDIEDLFAFDPTGGMWFLNLGRNFIFPTEAWYHLLFLGAVLLMVRGRPAAALGCAALLSASHPWSGLQLACVLLGWGLLERWMRSGAVSGRQLAATALLLGAHLGYYLLVLGSSEEHAAVMSQTIHAAQGWTYEAQHFVPAYALVGALALWRMRTPGLAAATLATPQARLFLAWAGVSFALANNEFALKPDIQPLHFTRGHVWSGLFLLGAPALIALFDRLLSRKALGGLACAGLLAVFLADNAAFLGTFHRRPSTGNKQVRLTPEFRELAAFLSEDSQRGCLVLTQPGVPHQPLDPVSSLLTVYSPLRTWSGHGFNTPHVVQRNAEIAALFDEGHVLPEWRRRSVLILLRSERPQPDWLAGSGAVRVFANAAFSAWRRDPTPSP